MKTCRVCNQEKPKADFHRDRQQKDGLCVRCKVCNCQHVRNARMSDPEKYKARQRDRHAANREIDNARCIKYRNKKWRQSNKALINFYDANRRAAEKQATPPWADMFILKEAYHLAKLREKATGFKWHVDHVVPLQSKIVCGLHAHTNIQVIPGKANIEKGNRSWPDMP